MKEKGDVYAAFHILCLISIFNTVIIKLKSVFRSHRISSFYIVGKLIAKLYNCHICNIFGCESSHNKL